MSLNFANGPSGAPSATSIIASTVERSLQTDLFIKKEVVRYLERVSTAVVSGSDQQHFRVSPPGSVQATRTASSLRSVGTITPSHSSNNSGSSIAHHQLPTDAQLTALGEIAARCNSFCAVLTSLSVFDFDVFRRRLNAMVRAKNSTLLTVDEVVGLANRAAKLEQMTAPGRLAEYVVAATVVAFSGGAEDSPYASFVRLQDLATANIKSSLSIPLPASAGADTSSANGDSRDDVNETEPAAAAPAAPFYKVLQEDVQRNETYRIGTSSHTPALVLSAVYFITSVWADHPDHWPLVVDPHRLVESLWVKQLPKAVVVRYQESTISAVFDVYCEADVVLVITGLPESVPAAIAAKFGQRTLHASSFRLLLVASSNHKVPSWASPSSVCAFHVPPLDGGTAAHVALEDVFQMAWPQDAQAIEELQAEVLAFGTTVYSAEEALWEASVDPTAAAEARTHTARKALAAAQLGLEEAQRACDAKRKLRAEFRIVAEISSRLFLVWSRAILRENARFAGGAKRVSAMTLPTPTQSIPLRFDAFCDEVVRPAVHQHLTEGSKHFTKCKSEAAQEILAWSGRLCERQLLDQQKSRSMESHSAVSIALHVVRCFVLGHSSGGGSHGPSSTAPSSLPLLEQYRRVTSLWDVSLSSATCDNANGAASNGVAAMVATGSRPVIPRALVVFAVGLFPVVTDTETDVFARLQRLLLTLSSIRTLLLLDSFDASVREFNDWLGHVQTTKLRLQSVEEEVLSALVKGLQLLSDPARAPTLVDALSLFAVLRELLGAAKGMTAALLDEVPKRQAVAMANLMATYLEECRSVELEARDLLTTILQSGDTSGAIAAPMAAAVNPNRVLEHRDRIAALQDAKKRLLRTDPTGRAGAGLPLMRSVDKLVAVCLPTAASEE